MSRGTGLAERVAVSMRIGEKLTKRQMLARVGVKGTGASAGIISAVSSLIRRRLLIKSGFVMEHGVSVQLYERRGVGLTDGIEKVFPELAPRQRSRQ